VQILFLPEDLHLWEMIDVIRTVDHDTLARNPEKRGERADKIRELGETFEKAGIYLAEYLPTLKDTQGKTIAENISREFYQYGLSLQHKERKEDQIPDSAELSLEDKTKLDEWFLGRDVYQKRLARLGENPAEEQREEVGKKLFWFLGRDVYQKILARLGKNPAEEQREELRKKLFSVYFKALERVGYKADGEKPWETKVGPMQNLQDRIRRQITKTVEIPEREMKTAIFRRGMEKLVTEMRTPNWRDTFLNFLQEEVPFDLATEKVKLINTLEIPRLKAELEEIRQTGDIANSSAKELEIAKKIQEAVSSFPFKVREDKDGSPNHPSKMVETQFINCVGSSILGGGLLDEVGIKYWHADLPIHSSTVLITSDGKVYWQDFTPGNLKENYTEINSDMIDEKVDLLDVPEGGVTLHFKKWNPYYHVNGNLRVTLFRPEVGLQCHILNNTGSALSDLGRNKETPEAYQRRNEEAIEAYQQAINFDPKNANLYNGLGNALVNLGRNEEAIEAYQQAINFDPKNANLYNGLGNALVNLGRNEEAIEAYQQAINIDPKDANPCNGLGDALRGLGRYEEAIEAYQQFIELWNGDEYWIIRAEANIEKLRETLINSASVSAI
jgi:tetratricopeptide (TPR) repeat protein